MKSYIHKGLFRTKPNIYDGAFFSSVQPYFENVFNSIELPLGSSFCTTHPFVKKFTTENFRRKSPLLTVEQFFSKFGITQWNGVISKGFLS